MIDIRDQLPIQPDGYYAAILADPPTRFETRSEKGKGRSPDRHYRTMTFPELEALSEQIARISMTNTVLFLWTTWPNLEHSLRLARCWGFTFKTCAFDWLKGDGRSLDLFDDTIKAEMKMGYWTRSNGEPCLLLTRGNPRRWNADVRMGIIEPARQHSRKPDCVHGRIERLVAGPYLELFGRTRRPGWTVLGNEVGKFQNA